MSTQSPTPAAGTGDTTLTSVPTTPPTPAPRFLLRQRDPPTYSGDGCSDVEDWLRQVERICNHNNWDETLRLANVPFYLTGTPLTWYENNETSFDSWGTFKRLLVEAFGNTEDRTQKARQYLQTRHQACGEQFAAYMADVLQACRKVNPDMSEAEKIRHILKGLTHNFFNAVALHKFATVSELSASCRQFEDLQRQRILQEHSAPSLAPVALAEDASLTRLIRTIVREELALMGAGPLRATNSSPPTAEESYGVLRKLVQEEVRSMGAIATPPPQRIRPLYSEVCAATPTTPLRRPSYAEVCAAAPVAPPITTPIMAPVIRGPIDPERPPNVTQPLRPSYRQPPICFYCRLPGHIARRCYRRQFDMQQQRAWYQQTSDVFPPQERTPQYTTM